MTDLTPEARALADSIAAKAIAEVEASATLRACGSFSELHDVCDANCLGGACDDDNPFWHDAAFHDPEEGFTELGVALINEWQGQVDRHMRTRRG